MSRVTDGASRPASASSPATDSTIASDRRAMKLLRGRKGRASGARLGSEADWRRRVATVAGGVLLGLAAIAFADLADLAQRLFRDYLPHIGRFVLVTTPAIFMLVGWTTRRWFSAAAGSGIPQVIAASRRSESAAT